MANPFKPFYYYEHGSADVDVGDAPFDEVHNGGKPSRHHHFYFEDGTVVLRVRDTLFKIHRHFLTTHSLVFEGLFTLNNPTSTEGMDDDHPIILPGDDPVDFCRLLYLFYRHDPIVIPRFTAEQWLSVLALSTKYDMDKIRQSTIEQLQIVSPRLDPIRQIVAARQYNCPTLVDEPIQTLTARSQRLTLKEVQNLPIEDLHTIIEGRESRGHRPRCAWCPSSNYRCNSCNRTV